MKRFIQIGTGGFGKYWCTVVLPNVRNFMVPVAAVDISEKALENAAHLGLPAEKLYTDLDKALRENQADFVTIVTPIPTHESIIEQALAAGLDIVCEKPLGADMSSSTRILKRVQAAGRKLSVTMSHRMEAEKQTVERLVKSGQYGPLRYLVSRLAMARREARTEDPGELLTNLVRSAMIHNLDTMRAVSGANAKTVYATGWSVDHDPTRANSLSDGATVLAVLEMENGVRAQLEISMANAASLDGWSDEYLRAECADGTIIADHRQVTVHSSQGYPHPTVASIPWPDNAYWAHDLILNDFVNWLDGGPTPVTNIEDTIQACALAYATIESIRTRQVVDVQRFLAECV